MKKQMKNLCILWTHWFGLGRALKTIEKRWENSLLLLLPLLAFEFPWSDAENAKLKYLSWILHCPRRPCRLVLYKYRTISPTSHTHTHPQRWIWNRNRNRNRHLPSACALTRSLHSFMHSLMHLFILMSSQPRSPPLLPARTHWYSLRLRLLSRDSLWLQNIGLNPSIVAEEEEEEEGTLNSRFDCTLRWAGHEAELIMQCSSSCLRFLAQKRRGNRAVSTFA